MRNDVAALEPTHRRNVALFRHPTASPAEVLAGTASDGVDLSPYVASLSQSAEQLNATLRWHDELYTVNQPVPGEVIAIHMDGVLRWQGIIDAIPRFSEARSEDDGERSLTLSARPRDRFGLWRDVRAVSNIYPLGTDAAAIARDIARELLGLTPAEYSLPDTGLYTPFSDIQLADLTPWEMLRFLYQPLSREPYVDEMGRLKTISRDTTRTADITLDNSRVQRMGASRAGERVTAQRVKYLDPTLVEISQQEQSLASAGITAGFFKLEQKQRLYWSKDRRQRARNTRLVILQSVNSGLVSVGSESYSQRDPFSGEITVRTSAWVPGLATGSIGTLSVTSSIPDVAPPMGGPVKAVGRKAQVAAEVTLFTVMQSLGAGSYEIHGTPYDYINPKHTIEAFDDAAPAWAERITEIDNDLIGNRGTAEHLAVAELRYAAGEARGQDAIIIDDPRIERGDILDLPDGSRLYVTGYSRTLTRGAAGVLTVQGFLA